MPDVIGLQFRGASGSVQFDQTYKNRAFRQKATVTTTNAFGPGTGSFVQVTLTGAASPRLALRCAVGAAILHAVDNGSSLTYTIAVNGPVGTSLTYYWFDVPGGTSGDFGYVVFNPTTLEKTFDSRLRYADCAGFSTDVQGSAWSRTYVPGRQYAAVQCRSGFLRATSPAQQFGFYPINLTLYGFKHITNGLAVEGVAAPGGFSTTQFSELTPGAVLAIDVTNL